MAVEKNGTMSNQFLDNRMVSLVSEKYSFRNVFLRIFISIQPDYFIYLLVAIYDLIFRHNIQIEKTIELNTKKNLL